MQLSNWISQGQDIMIFYCKPGIGGQGIFWGIPAKQNGDFGRNFAYFPLIFFLFSAYGTPSTFFYGIPPISIYFLSIFRLKCYPILVLNSSIWYPFAAFPPTCLHILPIFCLYSTHFPPIFRLIYCPFSAGPVLPERMLNFCAIATAIFLRRQHWNSLTISTFSAAA